MWIYMKYTLNLALNSFKRWWECILRLRAMAMLKIAIFCIWSCLLYVYATKNKVHICLNKHKTKLAEWSKHFPNYSPIEDICRQAIQSSDPM